ncbi:Protein kinase-like domain containing protein [Rhypophila decipiens]
MDLNTLRSAICEVIQRLGFVPNPLFNELVSQESVTAILQHAVPDRNTADSYLDNLTSFVVRSAPKIFANLVLMEKPSLIQSFYANAVMDDVHPVHFDLWERENGVSSIGRHGTYDGRQGKVKDVFSSPGWEQGDITSFCQTQWRFLAPVFDGQEFWHDKLDAHMPMPFLDSNVRPADSSQSCSGHIETIKGGFARVEYRVIHKDHIKLSTTQISTRDTDRNHCIAVKTLLKFSTREATDEAKTLKTICDKFQSDHVIRAIAYFEMHDQRGYVERGLLFPWAQHGDLPSLWLASQSKGLKVSTAEARFPAFLAWVLNQLIGLTQAVAEMHQEIHNIRHGDIKPGNILCFQDRSQSDIMPIRLVLTDVGISKAHLESTKARKDKHQVTKTTLSTTRYAAPELHGNPDIDQLSRKFDVWSIGCVSVEMLIWLLYDYGEVKRFIDEADGGEEFYEIVQNGHNSRTIIIRRLVKRWLEHIKVEDGRCFSDTTLGRLITLIEEKLLVVEVDTLQAEQGGSSLTTRADPPGTSKSWWRFKKRKDKQSDRAKAPDQNRDNITNFPLGSPSRVSAVDAVTGFQAVAFALEGSNDKKLKAAGEGDPSDKRGPPKAMT